MSDSSPSNWRQKITGSALVLLIAAGATRVAWELLRPLVPVLIAIICLVGMYVFMVNRWFGR